MGTPHISTPTPTPSATAAASQQGKITTQNATNSARLAGGFGSTLLTGSGGVPQTATNAPKTLLGG